MERAYRPYRRAYEQLAPFYDNVSGTSKKILQSGHQMFNVFFYIGNRLRMQLSCRYMQIIHYENVRHDSFYLYSNSFVHIIILAVQLASRDPIVITRNSYP